ncbi:MAG: acyl-CoA synthetase FdrA [Elusimicrobiota bacterium]
MPVKTLIRKGVYFDSVSLMQIAKKLNSIPGVQDSAVIMATKENKNIISSSGLLSEEIKKASDNDLAIAVKSSDSKTAEKAISMAQGMLVSRGEKDEQNSGVISADSISQAVSSGDGLNLALISVNGRYAGDLALEAIENNLNVMIFSDNVPLERELELKKLGVKKGLLVMGPDCGTSIINGAPLGFANKVNSGNIGVVGPSGTGIQEFTCSVSNLGAGISQAIGTGTRDVKDEVGAITTVQALEMLSQDSRTSVIAVVSKPPQKKAMAKIVSAIRKIKKPVVAVFLGSQDEYNLKNLYMARNLYEAALKAYYLSRGEDPHLLKEKIYNEKIALSEKIKAEKAKKKKGQVYLRGLFSGGTFASQALWLLKPSIGPIFSNIPLSPELKLKNSMKLEKNSIIDLGEDEFTFGRPHPMIDYSLRNRLIVEQAGYRDVSVLLLDVVLGYGSNMNPLEELREPVKKAFSANPSLSIVAAVTGTSMDPQDKKSLTAGLKDLGVLVLENNYLSAFVAGEIIRAS